MKQLKIWSMIMLMIMIIPTKAYSQEVDIDERDLVGSWNRVEAQGTFDGYPYVSRSMVLAIISFRRTTLFTSSLLVHIVTVRALKSKRMMVIS